MHLKVQQWPQHIILSQTEMMALVKQDVERLNEQQQTRVLEAAALSGLPPAVHYLGRTGLFTHHPNYRYRNNNQQRQPPYAKQA